MAKIDPNGFMNRIGAGTRVQGEVVFEESVLINGELEGAVLIHGTLLVGSDAVIKADIDAADIEIQGVVQGKIHCRGRLKLRGSAHVLGDIETTILEVEEGALLQGKVSMKQDGQQLDLLPALQQDSSSSSMHTVA